MSDAPASPARPMRPEDYADGYPVRGVDHPTRDIILGAVIGAAALWLVPKILDATVGGWFDGQGSEELELEEA